MLIPINKIRIKEGRRELSTAGIDKLMESMAVVGLLNPISVDESNTLIAGNHRLEAAKRLGWTEIECSVRKLDGLQAELAEIDENFVRTPLTPMEENDLLLRRKEVYEALHPETRAGAAQAAGMNRAVGNNVGATVAPTSKSFVQDTAEQLGVSPSTIKSQVRAAKNTVPEAKAIIRESGVIVSKQDAVRLSQLEPEQQKEAASQLASGVIRSVKEFCEDDSQPEAPRQGKRVDLDSISDEEFHILQAVLHPVSNEQYAKVLAKFTEHTEETVQWINAFSTLWDALAVMPPEQLAQILQMTDDIRDALDTFRDKIGKGLGILLEYCPV